MVLAVRSRAVTRGLFTIIGVLTFLHVATLVARFGFGHPQALGFVPLFDTNREQNVPAFFSALNMLLCALLLALIAAGERTTRRSSWIGWALLAVLFVLLPFDELFAWHERLNGPVRAALKTSGAFEFAWVLPYGVLTLVVGALMLRLLAGIPSAIRYGMILSGVIFVSGAIGFEMLGSWVAGRHGIESLIYAACATIEELLEMSGIALFTHVLLEHMAAGGYSLEVETGATESAAITGVLTGAGEGNRTLV